MIDRHLLPVQKLLLAPVANLLLACGISANQITVAGFGLGLLAVPALAFGQFNLALGLVVLNRMFDGLDGAMARQTKPTDRGAFLDIALDFLFYAAIPFGFALADPAQNALAAAALLLGFVGTGSSFLAFATIAAKRGTTAVDYPQKGIYYLGGLTEGAETIGLFVLMCLWPQHFALFAWIFSTLCLFTTFSRWRQGYVAFGEK